MHLPRRSSGILLHPSSLPGPHGIGSLGAAAHRFIDFLVEAGQSVWQILPLGPVGFGASPYSSFCSVAGNPLLISLGRLLEQGHLRAADLSDVPFAKNSDSVDYAALERWKQPILGRAVEHFLHEGSSDRLDAYKTFCAQHAAWLDAYGLFMAVKDHFDARAAAEGYWGATWNTYWDQDIAMREPDAMQRWRDRLRARIENHKIWQFFFFEQWKDVRDYANRRGITIMGDMPIFVALDSADVWYAPQLFQLDAQRKELFVAGVPPDYFSATGQRWGNPLYDWDAMRESEFAWWILRFRSLLEQVNCIRIDHFRGFAACWTIPAAEQTAINGRWVNVPGSELFNTLRNTLGQLPFLAEDLGVITPDVEELRDQYEFPGMRVLQVGFENIEIGNIHLPEHHIENSVVYTGTHDNDTTLGWYLSLPDHKRQAMESFLGRKIEQPAWDLIRVAMESVANMCIVPMQDVLQLGSEARMNRPGQLAGNWRWRLASTDYAAAERARRLGQLTARCERAPGQ